MKTNALFSADRKYRYALWRIWDETLPQVMFIGLNPSDANESKDDPTVRRCITFAKSWQKDGRQQYGGIIIGNLFARCSPDPKVMMKDKEPIGTENDQWLLKLSKDASLVVGAWGDKGLFQNRGHEVRKMIPDLHYLKLNKSGEPSHPLYLLSDLKPQPLISKTTYNNIDSKNEAGCVLCQSCYEENDELICESNNKKVDAADICDSYSPR